MKTITLTILSTLGTILGSWADIVAYWPLKDGGHDMVIIPEQSLPIHKRVGREKREDDHFETTAALHVGLFSVDESLGIGEHFVPPHEVAEGVTDDRLLNATRSDETVDQVESISYFAIK